jgi:head-tail adaptor
MYKLARYIFILFLLLGIGANTFGQVRVFRRPPNFQQRVIRQQNGGVNKIEAVRESYINQRLKLTADEGQRFWPVYRRYWAAIKEIRRKKRLNNSADQANGTEQINRELYYERELVNTRSFYTSEFLKILPPDKVSEIFKSEREFQDELIKQLSERSQPVKNP